MDTHEKEDVYLLKKMNMINAIDQGRI